jgi:hypothetical protein
VLTQNGPTTLKQTDVSEGDVIEIGQAIQAALDDLSSIEAIAQQSYRHQNGFVKIPLKTKNGEKFRLHVYRVGAKADKNIHNHRWDFESKVLCGSLPMHLYEIVEGNSHRLHTYLRKGRLYTIEYLHKIGLIESRLINIRAGKKYLMKSHLYHKIAAVKELTITYMVTRKTVQNTCDLINVKDMSSTGEGIDEPPLSVQEVRKNLELILEKIQILKELV